MAMKGKNCVAIACDLRFGVQAQTISTDFKVCFAFVDYCLINQESTVASSYMNATC